MKLTLENLWYINYDQWASKQTDMGTFLNKYAHSYDINELESFLNISHEYYYTEINNYIVNRQKLELIKLWK